MMMGSLQTTPSNTLQQMKKERVLQVLPHVVMGAADLYAAAAVTILPTSDSFQAASPWLSGAIGVGHAVMGLANIVPREFGPARTHTEIARGCSHLITAAGFGGLAAGLGAYALPIIAIGEAARIWTTWLSRT